MFHFDLHDLAAESILFRKEQLECSQLNEELESCSSLKEIFDLVRAAVKEKMKESRAGLDIGLAELGNKPDALVSAFYQLGSNIIIVNNTPIRRIMETNPALMKPYLFSILLHEYLHSLGYIDEASVRSLSRDICAAVLGESHPATEMSGDMTGFFQYLLYPGGHSPMNEMRILEVDEIDYVG